MSTLTCLFPHEEVHYHSFETGRCDTCGRVHIGVEYYCESATGWLSPVFFECVDCTQDPMVRARLIVRLAIEDATGRALDAVHAAAYRARRTLNIDTVRED